MVELGVGKNMVRSMRFWALAAGVAVSIDRKGTLQLTSFGGTLLGASGLDPFLEDIRTLWLIHWRLATNTQTPLLAWDYLLNRWHDPEISQSRAITSLEKEVSKQSEALSRVTIAQHFDAFLHTYVPTRGRKGDIQEDNLDCPLVELALIVKIGDRENDQSAGKREPIYRFSHEEKPEITPELFAYCLNRFWTEWHPGEATLTLAEAAHGHASPGQIFKLPEQDVRSRLEGLERVTRGAFAYTESSSLEQVRKLHDIDGKQLLKAIYSPE